MKFSHYADLFLEFKKHELKPSTYDKYCRIVSNRLGWFKNKEIEELKPSDVKRWLYSISDVGNKSKRHYLGVLSGIFQEALFDEIITRNPVKMVRIPKYEKPIIKPFNSDEVKLIMDNAEYPNYILYLAIAFYTGMRSGEIIALKKTDIDFKNGIISVKRSRGRFGESTPKTKGSIRDIPIIDLLYPYIQDMYNSHEDDYLFVSRYGEPYTTSESIYNHFWKPSLESLNIEYRRPYNTRHTYATNMLYNNLVSPLELSQLLGHANTQMVYDVYVNYIDNNYKTFDRSISIYK